MTSLRTRATKNQSRKSGLLLSILIGTATLLTACSELGVYDHLSELVQEEEVGERFILPDDPWSTSDSLYRRGLVLDNTSGSESLGGFPLMVKLDATRIDYAQTDGTDLRFFDAGGTDELYYEVERWDESGESIIWVRVPEIASGRFDYLWLYWGGGVSTVYHDAAQVWSEYDLVLHFNGDATDSSPNGWDATSIGSVAYENAAVGQGARIGDTATKSYLEVSQYTTAYNHTRLGAYTLEVYMKGDSPPSTAASTGAVMAQRHFNIGWDHTNASFAGSYHLNDESDAGVGGWQSVPQATSLQAGQWYYAAGVFDGSNGTATSYRNGTVDGQITGLNPLTGDRVDYLRIGTGSNQATVMSGVVDEVRLYMGARSSAWIEAQYASMQDSWIEFYPVQPAP